MNAPEKTKTQISNQNSIAASGRVCATTDSDDDSRTETASMGSTTDTASEILHLNCYVLNKMSPEKKHDKFCIKKNQKKYKEKSTHTKQREYC